VTRSLIRGLILLHSGDFYARRVFVEVWSIRDVCKDRFGGIRGQVDIDCKAYGCISGTADTMRNAGFEGRDRSVT